MDERIVTEMKQNRQTWRSIAILAFLLAIPAAVRADAVTDWNAIAVQATVTGARPGPTGVLDIAMTQAAVYDAVQAIESKFEPYHVVIPGASGSPVAAAAKAAHDVLVNRFPAQAAFLDMTYQLYLLNHGLPEDDPGVAVGAAAAAGIIALRAGDGSFPVVPPPPFVGGTDVGVWRPTPPAFAPMLAPWLGEVTPFTLESPSQFLAPPPPSVTSRQYARDYDEVKALGSLNNSARTAEQTDQAFFWGGNFPVMWNQVLREVAAAHVSDIADSSRLFALGDMAMADAVITSWNSKVHYVYWRPITAIREGDNDGNPLTAGDPSWTSLIATPPYPDYTSGANNITAAATRSLLLFFGSNSVPFSVTTTNTGPTQQDTRTFDHFTDAEREVADARILLGIHFRFADEEARQQGKRVANWAFENFLRPLGQ
jgi:hypothetical protein